MKEISILVGGKARDGTAIITVKYANNIFFNALQALPGEAQSLSSPASRGTMPYAGNIWR